MKKNVSAINSKEYWDERFETNWKDYGGNEQTQFFASTLLNLLPDWLIHEINENGDAICDLGCAEGDALPVYRTVFHTSPIHGEDFSESAINYAKNAHPEFSFQINNLLEPEGKEKYPLVICSNVLEHFKDTYHTLSCICSRTTKYTVIMIPYREEFGAIEEHESIFRTKNILTKVEDNYLIYAKSIFCGSKYYPSEQMLLIYAKNPKYSILSDISEEICTETLTTLQKEKENTQRELDSELSQNTQLREKILRLEELDIEAKSQIESLKKELTEKNVRIENLLTEIDIQQSMIGKKGGEIELLEKELAEKNASIEGFQTENMQISFLTNEIRVKNEYLQQAEALCQYFATGKLMKLNHLLFRIKSQFLGGTRSDRKEFWSWIQGKMRGTNRTLGEGIKYNPWMVVSHKLSDAINYKFNSSEFSPSVALSITSEDATVNNLSMDTKRILTQDYKKYDVIILSVIDYDFRYQRPQHFATRFAANGHRVYYVNANFVRPDFSHEECSNLYVVDFSCENCNAIYDVVGEKYLPWMRKKLDNLILQQAIRDAVVVVDYPNWVCGAKYLREQYGFRIVTDYMDDYTGFIGTAQDFLKSNCIKLLKESDLIVSSSQFLYDVACKYANSNKIRIVRNGTEVDYFHKAIELQKKYKERKQIGYYGAVAHWFAWEKVCSVAEAFPECDIVIIGAVTEYEDRLRKYPNIKLLGEKKYSELPEYLANFNVCLIPFDTSTDLIKATNPVKFYEYLSAGKKIVATEIPELMPYRDEYVYMSNEDDQFIDYVKKCLEGTDCLRNESECIRFAAENDWQNRFDAFSKACTETTPKVSVVVLTYNNLELNKKCIGSILKKTAYPNYELLIVDNCSTDGTRDYLADLERLNLPNVKIIFNDVNAGFAAGNNIGIKQSTGEYVLLLNNDTVVSRGWITAMVKHLNNNPKLGMCNPVTNSIGNESQIAVSYRNQEEMDIFAYAYNSTHMNEEYLETDRLPLFATIIRREMIDKIGLLDEQYKIGMFEDDDYTEAAKTAGYDIAIAEDAFIHHVNNASFKKMDDAKYRQIFEENKAIFENKWHKKWTMPKYRDGISANSNANVTI